MRHSGFSATTATAHAERAPWHFVEAEHAPAPAGARLAAVGHALAPHRYEQDALIAAITALWARHHHNPARIERFHQAVQVGARHLALPLEDYARLEHFGQANDAFIEIGTDLGAEAIAAALRAADLDPRDVDALFFTTVTGLAVPTIDARLVSRLGLRRDVRRVPLFGLGCVGGAAGLARVNDYLRGAPDHVAVLLSVELCSLTLQRDDLSIANLVATGLFGDGAVALVAVGARHALDAERAGESSLGVGRTAPAVELERVGSTRLAALGAPLPRVLATRSVFYDDTEHIMGWNIGPRGFEVVLSAELPELVRTCLEDDVAAFLAEHELRLSDIDTWICHPGGPKVLDAVEDALSLPPDALAISRASLAHVGNLSSASVLLVLEQTLREHPPTGTGRALLLAMGPGFCAELVLLSW